MARILVLMVWLILKIIILLNSHEFEFIFVGIKVGSQKTTEGNVYVLYNPLQRIIIYENYTKRRDYIYEAVSYFR